MMTEDNTRDIAIAVKTKVDLLEEDIAEIKRDMRRLMTVLDQNSGLAGTLKVLGYGGSGGVVAFLTDHWVGISKKLGL